MLHCSVGKGSTDECHPDCGGSRHTWASVVFATQYPFTCLLVKDYDSLLGLCCSTNLSLWSLSGVDSISEFGAVGSCNTFASGLASNVCHPWPLRWLSESQTKIFIQSFGENNSPLSTGFVVMRM